MEGEGSQGANRGADSKELEDSYRSIAAACEAKNQKESARGSGRCDERPTARMSRDDSTGESNIAVDTNGNRTSAEASPGKTEGSNQFDG